MCKENAFKYFARRQLIPNWQGACSRREQKCIDIHCKQENIGKAMQEDNKSKGHRILPISRRRFVQGLAAGGVVAALDWGGGQLFGETGQQRTPATLTGKDFELTIDSLPANFTDGHSVATAVNGSVPGPILRWREGDTVTLAVTNPLKVRSAIHWYGMPVAAGMDGVPG